MAAPPTFPSHGPSVAMGAAGRRGWHLAPGGEDGHAMNPAATDQERREGGQAPGGRATPRVLKAGEQGGRSAAQLIRGGGRGSPCIHHCGHEGRVLPRAA